MNRKSYVLAVGVMLTTLGLLIPAESARAQTIVHSFDGDKGPGLGACQSGITHCGIPEMDAAANGEEVVEVTWQNVRVYDYSGRLLESTPMSTFIRNAGLDPVPPKAQGPFEPIAQHQIAAPGASPAKQ